MRAADTDKTDRDRLHITALAFVHHSSPKKIIIGLDGISFADITRLTASGTMPHLKHIIASGYLQPLHVSLPAVSNVCWSSFMTGENPGAHGIFGFNEVDPHTYACTYPDFRQLKVAPFFARPNTRSRSIVINLPGTFPAPEIAGVLIAGFPVPQMKNAIFPTSYQHLLDEAGYRPDNDITRFSGDTSALLAELSCQLHSRQQIAEFLWQHEQWETFVIIYTEFDRLFHFLYNAVFDATHSAYEEIGLLLGELDDCLFTWWSRIHDSAEYSLMMLSDHGFGCAQNDVFINPILRANDFLKTPPGLHLDYTQLTQDSAAFSLDPGRIYIHRSGYFQHGGVTASDYDRTCNAISRLMKSYTIMGQPVTREVFHKEEIYQGRFRDFAPDLIALPATGFELKAGWMIANECRPAIFCGRHEHRFAFFYTWPESPPANIQNIADIIPAFFPA